MDSPLPDPRDPAEVRAEVTALMERVKARRPGFTYEISRTLRGAPRTMTTAMRPSVTTVAAAIERVLDRKASSSCHPAPTTRNTSTGSGA